MVEDMASGVYLLCFRHPDGSKGHYEHAGHYVGYTDNIARRINHHRAGTGANLLRYVVGAGLDFVIARTWPGADRTRERSLHGQGGKAKFCPVCRAESPVLVSHRHDERETV